MGDKRFMAERLLKKKPRKVVPVGTYKGDQLTKWRGWYNYPLLMPVMDTVGSPASARVENAIRTGTLTVEDFRGAFQKTMTPYIFVRIETAPPAKPSADMPF